MAIAVSGNFNGQHCKEPKYSGPRRRKRKLDGERPKSIIWDPAKEQLFKEVIPEGKVAAYTCVPCPGRSNPVPLYLDVGCREIGSEDSGPRYLLARVDLKQLGLAEWWNRHRGRTHEIWVKGRVPEPRIHERNSWPKEGRSGQGLSAPEMPQRPKSV